MDLGIRKAFILAGGKGERLRPLTDQIPKVLVEVNGKPLIQWNMELCKKFGVREIVLGVGHLHEHIQERFGNGKSSGLRIAYSVEKTFLGTAGALKEAERFFLEEKKFIMMNGDEVKDIAFQKLDAVLERNRAQAAIALTRVTDVSQFGSVQLNGNKITTFLEKNEQPQNDLNLVNSGAYILRKEILTRIPTGEAVSIEKQVFPVLAKEGLLVGMANNGQWFPTDTLERLEKARQEWKTRF